MSLTHDTFTVTVFWKSCHCSQNVPRFYCFQNFAAVAAAKAKLIIGRVTFFVKIGVERRIYNRTRVSAAQHLFWHWMSSFWACCNKIEPSNNANAFLILAFTITRKKERERETLPLLPCIVKPVSEQLFIRETKKRQRQNIMFLVSQGGYRGNFIRFCLNR